MSYLNWMYKAWLPMYLFTIAAAVVRFAFHQHWSLWWLSVPLGIWAVSLWLMVMSLNFQIRWMQRELNQLKREIQ